MAKSAEDRPASAAEVRRLLAPLLAACGAVPGRPERLREPSAPALPAPAPGATAGNALLLLGGDEGPTVVLWGGERIVLGKQRGPGTDLVVRDYPEEEHRERIARVSRQHAAIAVGADGTPTIEDLGSANGTFVAGERVVPRQPRPLPPGSEVGLAGATSLRVRATADRAVVLERCGNRPGLVYALVPGRISIGAADSDLPLAQASRRAELSWTPDGWLVDGLPSSHIDLGGLELHAQPLAGWL